MIISFFFFFNSYLRSYIESFPIVFPGLRPVAAPIDPIFKYGIFLPVTNHRKICTVISKNI